MALHVGDTEGVLFANQRIRTPLAVSGEVAVSQVVAGEALVASGVVVFEDSEGKAGRRFICTSFGAHPVAVLAELL